MKIQTLAALLLTGLVALTAAHAQDTKLEEKTAFCATSVELLRKRDSSDLYVCETSVHMCGSYRKASCLDDARQGGWDVASRTQKTLLTDFANTPCNCVGTQYVLTRKAPAAAPVAAAITPAGTTVLPSGAPVATAPMVVANTSAAALASEIEGLKLDNQQIRRLLEQLQRQLDELRRSLPAAK